MQLSKGIIYFLLLALFISLSQAVPSNQTFTTTINVSIDLNLNKVIVVTESGNFTFPSNVTNFYTGSSLSVTRVVELTQLVVTNQTNFTCAPTLCNEYNNHQPNYRDKCDQRYYHYQ
jgi:hypothetical protein